MSGVAARRRQIDREGVAWPVSGYYCTVCGSHLHPILVRDCETRHLLCGPAPRQKLTLLADVAKT